MTIKRSNIVKPIIHLLSWSIILIFSYFISDKDGKDSKSNDLTHVWLPLIEAAIIFYLNYFLLIERFIFNKKQYGLFIFINVLVIVIFRFDKPILDFLSGQDFNNHINKGNEKKLGHKSSHQSEPFSLIKSLFGLIMPVVFALLTKATELWSKFELKKKEVENTQLASELKSLKYQLQPHFFFNSLNNIYSLVDTSPEKAQEAIHSLSKLMKYLLYETNTEKVDLFTELNFVKKYIQLMEIRQSEDIKTTYKFPNIENNQYSIAPLLLIPIIENAYKHGVSAMHKSKITFFISITNDNLLFLSTNSNFPKVQTDLSGSGIGLKNLKKRLELIYPDKHYLTTEVKDNRFSLTLSIELDNTTRNKA